MIARRNFLRGGAAIVSLGAAPASLLKGAIAFAQQNPAYVAAESSGKILILVQLAGGNDGLATVVPMGDGRYQSARRTLAAAEEQLLPIEAGFGFAPQLVGMKGLWDAGKLAVVRGVGYPEQNYSHFKSMAIWEAGDPKLALDNGWLGRTLEAMESEQHDPFFGFNVGSTTPPELRSSRISIPSVRSPGDYGVKVKGQAAPSNDPRTATLLKLYEQYPADSPYGVLLETTADTAVQSAAQLAEAATRYQPAVAYPESSFGQGLQLLAETIIGGLGIRVGHITLGGFDTHNNQADEHADLLTTLDEGLAAFQADLDAQGRADEVIVLTWSEFGRRVDENANGGTDHGSASCAFVIGSSVKRGLYGDQPSLAQLIDQGNLQYTTDFRSIYATVIERWMGIPAEPLLGGRWEALSFV